MSRTAARAAAMQMVFEKISGGQGGEDTLQMVYDELRQGGVHGVESVGRKEPDEEDRAYIFRVLEGVLNQRYLIDKKIETVSRDWPLDRMPLVDLTVMRLAVWEMMNEPDIPGNVSIAEALELIDCYSDPEDKKFVNGVLGSIWRELEATHD